MDFLHQDAVMLDEVTPFPINNLTEVWNLEASVLYIDHIVAPYYKEEIILSTWFWMRGPYYANAFVSVCIWIWKQLSPALPFCSILMTVEHRYLILFPLTNFPLLRPLWCEQGNGWFTPSTLLILIFKTKRLSRSSEHAEYHLCISMTVCNVFYVIYEL